MAEKLLKDYSELELLTMSDAEFEAVNAATVDHLLDHMRQAGEEMSRRAHERDPGLAARLERYRLERPEEWEAMERSKVAGAPERRAELIESLGARYRDKRAAFRLRAKEAPLPTTAVTVEGVAPAGDLGLGV